MPIQFIFWPNIPEPEWLWIRPYESAH